MKFCVFLLGFLACIGGCSAKDTSDPYATVPDFCTAWGKSACNSTVVNHCSGMDTTAALTEICVEKQSAFCEGLINAHTGYNSAQAKTCLDAVGHAYADATLTGPEIATVRQLGDPCNHLFKGPKAKGDSCTADADCDTVHNVQCVMKNGVGTCVIPTVVPNGTSCAAPEASCNTGFYCGNGNCIQQSAAKASCTADYQCAEGLVCAGADADAGATTGTCTARVSQTACTADSDCTTNACETATGKCVTSIFLSPAETACGDLQ
jgi:hypothetical protein